MKYSSLLLFWLISSATYADPAGLPQTPIYIDVRSPAEYESGHLRGAYNLNFDAISERIHELTTAKDAPIVLYCKSGRRSGFAKEALESLGFANVLNAGGLNDVLHEHGGRLVGGPATCGASEC
jgi:phage shock protein E